MNNEYQTNMLNEQFAYGAIDENKLWAYGNPVTIVDLINHLYIKSVER